MALEEEGYDEEGEEERPKKKKKKKDGKGAEGEKKKFPKVFARFGFKCIFAKLKSKKNVVIQGFLQSSVDDRFFSLAEMEAAADELEKEGAIEEGILDDGEVRSYRFILSCNYFQLFALHRVYSISFQLLGLISCRLFHC